jgi:hypothetical protein
MASERPGEERVVRDADDDDAVDRNEAGLEDGGRLGASTPPNVDVHKLGEGDNPELDWGEPEPGAVHSQTNSRRGVKTEAERGQGARTRQANKDQISRRS